MPLPIFSAYAPTVLVARRSVAADQSEIEVRPPDGALAAFRRAGQFCRIRVTTAQGAARDGIFALISSPGDGTLRFLVRAPSPDGGPEGGEAADRLVAMPVPSPIEITMPAGDGFALERAIGRDVYFVATGTAIAPVRAAVEQVLRDRDRYGALSVDHGLRSPEHLAIAEDIARWRSMGVEVRLHYSEPTNAGAPRGVRVQQAVFEHVRDVRRAAFVAAGQSAMLRELRARVVEHGGDPELVLHNY